MIRLTVFVYFLILSIQCLNGQTSNKINRSIQALKTTKFHKTLEHHRTYIQNSVSLFKHHLEVYPITEGDTICHEIKTNYERVRKQYNFVLERLKMDLSDPRQMKRFLRHPNRESEHYLAEIKKAKEDYSFFVQRRMDEYTQGSYASFPVFEAIIGAWTVYQLFDKIIRHFIGLSNEWKQEYARVAPEFLETYYFADLRLPPWEEVVQ